MLTLPLSAPGAPPPRNFIVMIADGCGSEQYTLARWYKGAPLALDTMAVGQVRTYIANSVIADSAPAATAFATGVRSGQRVIGMAPAETTLPGLPAPAEPYRPLATVAEGARLAGKSVGLVATSRLSHATPAAYLAHVPSRYQESDIMEQMLHQGATVLLGGGRRLCLPQAQGGKRGDGQDLWARLSGRGYQLPRSAEELAQAKPGKVAGFFAGSHLAAEIDRPTLAPGQPTLEAMTAKALEILDANPKGFFLMVEGSQIDWACHANDPAHLIGDLLMFDRAVQVALDFAKKDGHTLVLAFSDHNTGGMTLGNASTQIDYMTTGLEQMLAPLRAMRMSAPAIWRTMGDNPNPVKLRRALREHWGAAVSPSEAQAMIAAASQAKLYPKKYEPWFGVGEIFCRSHTVVGWTTHGHTGGDVPLFAYGPGSPHGTLDGPQLGRFTAQALGLDLKALSQRLFVEAQQAFGPERVSLRQEASGQRVVEIRRQGGAARLPLNQNRLLLDGREIALEGVVVYAEPTGKIYLPRQAVELIKAPKP
ncbi:alkaline phosphatase [Desulfoferula mesophila]|uniref:alkaline phosphatase n=1 Tax=Desulfoferula mesophila TaxID=3058419 RepID=UPI0030CCB181